MTLEIFLICAAFYCLSSSISNFMDMYWLWKTRKKAEKDFDKARGIMDDLIHNSKNKTEKTIPVKIGEVN